MLQNNATQRMVRTISACLLIGFLFLVNGCGPRQSVTVYPAPGDLSDIEGLEESRLFDMTANGQDVFVYHGYELDTERASGRGTSFAVLEAPNGVTLKVTSGEPLNNWWVRPEPQSVEQIDASTLKIVVDHPSKFMVSNDWPDSLGRTLIVSVDGPETDVPDPDDPSVIYLEPGIHRYGQAWNPFSEEKRTLYLAGGAVLEATLKIKDTDDIRICGRGLFAQAFVPHAREAGREPEWDAEWLGISIRNCDNVRVEGIAIMSSPSYQLEAADCDHVVFRNLKLCGAGERNNDGIHTYGRQVLVEDCLISSNDDRICITGLYDEDDVPPGIAWDGSDKLVGCLVEDITIRNVVFHATEQQVGGDIMLTWNGSDQARNVLVENVTSLGGGTGFLAARHGGSALIYNVIIRNARLDHPKLFNAIIHENRYQGAGGGYARDIYLENIRIDAPPETIGLRLLGRNARSNIQRWTFNQITANGVLLNSLDGTRVETNEFVTDLRFNQPALFLTAPNRHDVLPVNQPLTLKAKSLGLDEVVPVAFLINGEKIGESLDAHPAVSWTPGASGEYAVQAVMPGKAKSAEIFVKVGKP